MIVRYHFQLCPGPRTYLSLSDFNEEVLREVTAPNLFHNLGAPSMPGQIRLYAGDWLSLSALLSSGEGSGVALFDLILTAETLYTSETTRKVSLRSGDI